MLPQVLPMLAVSAAPFDASVPRPWRELFLLAIGEHG